jgi:hypothetical protein
MGRFPDKFPGYIQIKYSPETSYAILHDPFSFTKQNLAEFAERVGRSLDKSG